MAKNNVLQISALSEHKQGGRGACENRLQRQPNAGVRPKNTRLMRCQVPQMLVPEGFSITAQDICKQGIVTELPESQQLQLVTDEQSTCGTGNKTQGCGDVVKALAM